MPTSAPPSRRCPSRPEPELQLTRPGSARAFLVEAGRPHARALAFRDLPFGLTACRSAEQGWCRFDEVSEAGGDRPADEAAIKGVERRLTGLSQREV